MTRILLVVDDYNEMVYLQTLLRKLGMDVEAIGNARSFSETFLGFNPQSLIMTAHGKKVSGVKLGKAVTKHSGKPAIILLKSIGQVFTEEEIKDSQVDKVIDSPVNILHLTKAICELNGLNFDQLSQKLAKVLSADRNKDASSSNPASPEKAAIEEREKDSIVHIRGNKTTHSTSYIGSNDNEPSPLEESKSDTSEFDEEPPVIQTTMATEERALKYQTFLKNLEDKPKDVGGFSREAIKKFNRQHRKSKQDEKSKELDTSKKEFVNALFKGRKSS